MNTELASVYQNLTSHLLGSETASELLMTGLLADGHVLIQGAPGMGKTSLAKVVALSIQSTFRRIQFTPDLLPSEITGYNVYDQSSGEFAFHKGPVFSNVILADEINRASPRTQSALLEAMNEAQVSVDGKTYQLSKPFFVIATENHLSSTGTFPLPDSQLDRFLLSFDMPAPSAETQVDILALHTNGRQTKEIPAVLAEEQVVDIQADVHRIHVSRNVMEYVVNLCNAMESCRDLVTGPSTRASIALMSAAKAQAYLCDRDSVYPDDVKRVFPYVFRHRMVLKSGGGRNDLRVTKILGEILSSTSIPMGT